MNYRDVVASNNELLEEFLTRLYVDHPATFRNLRNRVWLLYAEDIDEKIDDTKDLLHHRFAYADKLRIMHLNAKRNKPPRRMNLIYCY